ncbi:MAG: hypothetical protein JNN12_04420 [Bacteroidetes Order II. Incertae sedis bacterium]|nr:hypothetical protein [Bacteroidetes Order II. bacterium]
MYLFTEILRYLHSYNRWAILILMALVLVKSFQGWKANMEMSPSLRKQSVILTGLFHLQLLVGLILYAIIYIPFWQGMGMALMKVSAIRFYAVEHLLLMILAVVMVQIGSIASKKANTSMLAHKKLFMYQLSALFLLLLSLLPGLMTGKMAWFRF